MRVGILKPAIAKGNGQHSLLFCFVPLQFNSAVPKVVLNSLRHSNINGKVAFKLMFRSVDLLFILGVKGRFRDVDYSCSRVFGERRKLHWRF